GADRDEPKRLSPRLAPPRERIVSDHEALHIVRYVHPQNSWQPLLRKGDEHYSAADRRLRRSSGTARSFVNADNPNEGATAAWVRGDARGDRRPGARNDYQHCAVRHLSPSRDGDPLRDE